ncbi:MAG: PEP-CTERM sorting domain-containing protein [Rhizomicrobium sp.]
MTQLRTTLVIAALGIAALASSPARADLYIFVGGVQVSDNQDVDNGVVIDTNPSNSSASYTCTASCAASLGWTINSLSVTGVDDPLPLGELFDADNMEVSHQRGSSTLTLEMAETGLTAAGVNGFESIFKGTLTGDISATRTFYIDPDNGTSLTDPNLEKLDTITTTCTGGNCDTSGKSWNYALGSSMYSIIETVVLTPGSPSTGSISSDDQLDIPEPMSLSLFGSGLLALGAIRRRRKVAKST